MSNRCRDHYQLVTKNIPVNSSTYKAVPLVCMFTRPDAKKFVDNIETTKEEKRLGVFYTVSHRIISLDWSN